MVPKKYPLELQERASRLASEASHRRLSRQYRRFLRQRHGRRRSTRCSRPNSSATAVPGGASTTSRSPPPNTSTGTTTGDSTARSAWSHQSSTKLPTSTVTARSSRIRQSSSSPVLSAQTARQFGIQARIAMLSYSTGESGSGADVEKVRMATGLVRRRQPDLLVEGPIQYDAAADPAVAAAKMPCSAVAGRATVFVFPDLNTYKAVQRSACAVAIGPILQGLNKPHQRSLAWRARARHRQHGGHHRDPSPG